MDLKIALDHPLTTLKVVGIQSQFDPPVVQVFTALGRMENGDFLPSPLEPTMTLTEGDATQVLEDPKCVVGFVASKFGGTLIQENKEGSH